MRRQGEGEREPNQPRVAFEGLRKALPFWSGIGASPFVCSVIAKGYKLNWSKAHPDDVGIFPGNRRSAEEEHEFVVRQVMEWLRGGAVEEGARGECFLSPLSVVKQGAKMRLIHDLSFLNNFVAKTKFHVDDLETVWDMLPTGGYMATFDLATGYHHVQIDQEDRKWLGFSVRIEGKERVFKFAALPFGLSPAPWVFTKVFRTLVRKWRGNGIKCAMYLDDGFIFAETEEACRAAVEVVRTDLREAGAQVAEGKSNWQPSQWARWLGFEIDLKKGAVRISEERRQNAIARIEKVMNTPSPSVYERQVVAGTIASMHLIVGDEGARRAKGLNGQTERMQIEGEKRAPLTQHEEGELKFWLAKLYAGFERSIRDTVWKDDLIVEVDASAVALGAVLKEAGKSGARNLTVSEREESSTQRELRAVLFGIETFQSDLEGKRVTIKTDNQSAVRILQRGSSKEALHELSLQATAILEKVRAHARFVWIPRELNTDADEASRWIDNDDWGIRKEVFLICAGKWGFPHVDMFANEKNAKCERFYSRGWCPRAEGVDAFGHEDIWRERDLLLWLVPPPNLLVKTVVWARETKARCILGMPNWPGHAVTPLLWDGGRYRGLVMDTLEYGKGANILIPATSAEGVFSSERILSNFIFLHCDFARL